MQPDNWNDKEVWLLVQQDDREAYNLIYCRYLEIIFATIFKKVDIRVDAEDITQDVFLSLWEQRKSIQIQGKLFSYLYSIARFKTYKYIREKNLSGRYQQQWDSWLENGIEPVTEPEAFRLSDMKTMECDMNREITELPPQMKRIYHLNIENGLSIPETANRLNISPHTVKKHLVNIKRQLRTVVLRVCFLLP